MAVKKDWLKKYEEVKDMLCSPIHYDDLFAKKEIDGKEITIIKMGEVHFPTGKILVRDPLVYLEDRKEEPYFQEVPKGVFQLETLAAKIEEGHFRYIATRIKFSDKKAKLYREALVGHENLDNLNKDSYFGFNVDAGLASVVDVVTRDQYCDFVEEWYRKNPDKNIYDDYFAQEFKKSYELYPQYQRPDGDWINYQLEGTDLSVPMIQSGFGDGTYPVYFGYDEEDNICELVIEYIFLEI